MTRDLCKSTDVFLKTAKFKACISTIYPKILLYARSTSKVYVIMSVKNIEKHIEENVVGEKCQGPHWLLNVVFGLLEQQ